MALSIETIHRYADVCTPNTETGSLNYKAFARAIEVEVRKEDTELIRQLVEALEHIHRCIPMGGFAQIHWGSSTFEQIVQAAEAGRARLEQPCA